MLSDGTDSLQEETAVLTDRKWNSESSEEAENSSARS